MEVAPFFADFHHFCLFSPFFIDFHDLRTFAAIYILSRFAHFFRKFFLAKIAFSATSHVFCMYASSAIIVDANRGCSNIMDVHSSNQSSPDGAEIRNKYGRQIKPCRTRIIAICVFPQSYVSARKVREILSHILSFFALG